MGYAKSLKKLFPGISLYPGDLLLLERFQIKYLPERVLKKEFATLLRAYPYVQQFLLTKYPPLDEFIMGVLEESEVVTSKQQINDDCTEALWEIADLIAYNKFPGLYDTNTHFDWLPDEIISKRSVQGKVVADVGAGTGQLAFLMAKQAKTVYAIEPVGSFRCFIREKAEKENCSNVFAIDGFLDLIPLPDNTLDILMTSNAIGWNLDMELKEIERVVKPEGCIVHLIRTMDKNAENKFHDILISQDWNYQYNDVEDGDWRKFKYAKCME